MLKSIREFFQQGLEEGRDNDRPDNRVELATAVLMLEISLADSTIDSEEISAIKTALTRHFNMTEQQADELIELARQEVDLAVSLHEFTRMLNENLDTAEKIGVIESLWKVAFADAVLDKYEEHYIRKVADLLYISHKDYLRAKHRVADRYDS